MALKSVTIGLVKHLCEIKTTVDTVMTKIKP